VWVDFCARRRFEIASYRSIQAGAEELGMNELREMCRRFVENEEEMADLFLSASRRGDPVF
jgi:ferritin-like metal-binding protein YciE